MAAWAWNSPKLVADEGCLEYVDALGDHEGVPLAAVLFGKRHQPPAGAGPGRAPCVVEQHEREQTRDLLVVGLAGQLAGQPDGLAGEVDVAGIALVEDQVQHAQHGGDVTGLVEPDPRDGALGPADPLGHRRLRHQVGLRDLARGQAANGP